MNWSSSTIAILVVLGVFGFFVGNFMAARPKAQESRVADFRLMARSFGIYPKLVACPEWLLQVLARHRPIKSNGYAHKPSAPPMIAQYTLTMNELSLPLAHYVITDGKWQLVPMAMHAPKIQKQVQRLDAKMVDLPPSIADRVLGLSIKSNHVALYWLDDQYQYSQKAYKLDKTQACADLTLLKNHLISWAQCVNDEKHTRS